MSALYSYVLRYDDGTAPNPFWNICTLVICKPAIRRTADFGDWVIGTGSKHVKLQDGKIHDFSDSLVYAMKVSGKLTLQNYDAYCKQQLTNKIPQPQSADPRLRLGDCVYEYMGEELPVVRESFHGDTYLQRDVKGRFALLSNHFFYFGVAAPYIPFELKNIIKRNQGHLRTENKALINLFETWIAQFEVNTLYGNPQMQIPKR